MCAMALNPAAWHPSRGLSPRQEPYDELLPDESVTFLGMGRSTSFPFRQWRASDPYRTVYFDEGHGQPIVMVHGLGGNATNWEPMAKELVSSHRVVGMDLVGCGSSMKPDLSYDVDVLRDHLTDFMDRRGLRDTVLVGHSLGGAVCMAAAVARPDLVRALVLISAAGIAPLPLWMRAGSKFMLKRQVLFPLLALSAGFILDNVFVDSPDCNPHVKWFRDSSMRDGAGYPNLWAFARVSETLCRDVVGRDYSDQLPNVQVPVLAVWGDADKLAVLSSVLDRLSGLERLRTVVLDGCGHMPMVERPSEVLAHLRRFMTAPP